jgi:pyruvate, orthophosphate dikinase
VTFAYALDEPLDLSESDARALLGGKATNLGVMARDLDLPVPPGFVITTETCRRYLAGGWPSGLDEELRERMRGVEAVLGRRFGDPTDPLLVSVRSGAPVSMPGMMDTILDLGLDDATTAGLARATGDEAFARSCRERFESSFRSIVGVSDVPSDPWAQLRLAIEAVFRSWQSDRARTYRQKEGIPDDLGTAVTVQAMVFGNRGPDSATGVLFTRDPATGEAALYGDVLFDAQGEDVVAGTHRTEPIAVLDERLPEVGAELRAAATRLEHHFRDLCDIEFTIESARLWLLQVRVGKRSPAAALRIAVDMAEDGSFPLTRGEAVERVRPLLADPPTTASARSGFLLPLVTGLPASPGVASGGIATSPEAALAAVATGAPAILVRAETSPDDVHGMAAAAGILTSRGGLASHAAVVARGWGIPAVVGATGLTVSDDRVEIGDRILRPGDVITIDGRTGEVFEGAIPGTTEVVPEVRTLLAWAAELGASDVPRTVDDAGDKTPLPVRKVTSDACLRVVAIKGFAQLPGIADAVLAAPTAIEPILDQMAIDGLISTSAGALKLTAAGTARAATLLAADRAAWGPGAADAALDAFLELDPQVKGTVTAWQLRDEDARVINDHTDPDYDAAVLDRLADVDAAAARWFTDAAAGPRRLDDYRSRLSRALAQARAGDGRFVASPRVDSYHGIWFELHEDLIGLAGRTREAEVEAGRA